MLCSATVNLPFQLSPILSLFAQVEYYFSDLNLATTDHLMRFIGKDPEGYGKFSLFLYLDLFWFSGHFAAYLQIFITR